MGASIIPNIGAAQQMLPDAAAVAPPQMPPQPSLYEQLSDMLVAALDFRHGRTGDGKKYSAREVDRWIASRMPPGLPIRTFKQLQAKLNELDRSGHRPIDVEDLPWYQRGALARVAKLGHAASLGTSDELTGLVSIRGGGPEAVARQFRQGKAQATEYLRNAELSVNPGLLNPAYWGMAGAALASGGATAAPGGTTIGPLTINTLRAPAATGILRSGAIGGGAGLLGSVGALPDYNPETLREAAPGIAANTALGVLLGGGAALYGKKATAAYQPGPLKLEKALEAAGGRAGLESAIARSGVESPMLAELGETTFGRLGQEIRRASAEATTEALDRLGAEIRSIQQAKQVAGQPWQNLNVPITSERAYQILQHPRMKRLVRELINDQQLQVGQPLTGRALEDIRQEVVSLGQRSARAGKGRLATMYRGWNNELREIIDASGQGMREARAAYQPLVTRERALLQAHKRMERMARTSGVPTETKVSARSEMAQELGLEAWQRKMLEARQMAGPLYTPGSAADFVRRIQEMQPWYSRLGNIGVGASIPATQLNPFFQQQVEP